MGQVINLFIVFASLCGIAFILYRKIPALLELPENRAEMVEKQKESIVRLLTSQAREKFLDKTLSSARTLASKTEMQASEWLERLRKKSEQKKEEFQESYWEQLQKKSQDKNDPPA